MRKQGIRPSRVTYTAAVVGINRRRRVSWAPKLANLARLLRNGPGIADTEVGKVEADGSSRTGGGGGEGGRGNNSEGGEGVDVRGASPEELDCSIEALGDADDACGATSLLRVMRREGFHASPRAYRSVIYACARVGLLNEAMALAKEMQSSSSSAVALQQQQQPARLSSSSHSDADGVHLQYKNGAVPSSPECPLLPEEKVIGSAPGWSREVQENMSRGVINEDEDAAEFNIAVVYNCIICNFARAATGGGDDSSSSGTVSICDRRTGTAPAGTAAGPATAAGTTGTATGSAVVEGHDEGRRRHEVTQGGTANKGKTGAAQDGANHVEGEGLVALLFGVADRAEGSLTDEAANGGVEIDHEEDAT